jgi:hypothetical protein
MNLPNASVTATDKSETRAVQWTRQYYPPISEPISAEVAGEIKRWLRNDAGSKDLGADTAFWCDLKISRRRSCAS